MTDSNDERTLEDRVRDVLCKDVAPLLDLGEGDIEVLGIDEGIVRVRLHGSCTGCVSAVQTLIFGMEEHLRQRVPEVEYLEVVP